MIIPIFDNHNVSKKSIGKIKFLKDFNPNKINWDKKCFGAGYIPKKIDKDGNILEAELLEISLIDCPNDKM